MCVAKRRLEQLKHEAAEKGDPLAADCLFPDATRTAVQLTITGRRPDGLPTSSSAIDLYMFY